MSPVPLIELRRRLTPKMRVALDLIREHGMTADGRPGGDRAALTGGSSHLDGSIPWVNWQTARALERAGLARIDRSVWELVGGAEQIEVGR